MTDSLISTLRRALCTGSKKHENDEMLVMDVIELARTKQTFPVVSVPKKEVTPRFCVDYCKHNGIAF